MVTDELLLGVRGDLSLFLVVRRHVHDKRGNTGGNISEGGQKQALFLLGRFFPFIFLSFSSTLLGTAMIPLFYVHTFLCVFA